MTPLPLIGRGQEIDAISEAWARVVGDPGQGPGIVMITGEAGTGKSRLVAEALEILRPAPAVLLSGTARTWAPAPYDWLASALGGHPLADVPAPADARARLLQRPDAPTGPFAPGALLRVAQDVVRTLLGDGPGVLVVEDLHDLDPESLTLIADLARTLSLPALMLVTSRPPDEGAFPSLAARASSRLTGTPRCVRRHLGPLTAAEVAALVAVNFDRVPPPDVVRATHDRTDGNPFWLTELLTAYRDSGLAALAGAPLPGHLAALILDRLAGEEPFVGRVARAIALLGDRVDLVDLADICGADVEPAVRRLVERGLLTLDGGPRFRHALAREAVAGSALPTERTAVYWRALACAATRGDDDAVARYAHALDRPESAAAALRAARVHLAAGLPASALRTVEIGLAAAPDSLPLLRAAVTAASGAGQFAAAADFASRWLELARRGQDILDLAAAHRELAGQCWYVGRVAEHRSNLEAAREHTTTALDLGVSAAPAEWARYLAEHARALLEAGQPAQEAAIEAITRARASGEPTAEASALVTLGAARNEPALILDGRRLAEQHRDAVSFSRAVNSLLTLRLPVVGESAAWRLVDEAMATVTRHGLEPAAGKIISTGVDLAIRFGDLARARHLLQTRLPVETDPPERVVQAATAGFLALEAGDESYARQMLALAEADVAGMDRPAALRRTALLAAVLGENAPVPAEPHFLLERARWTGRPVDPGFTEGSRTGAQLRCAMAAAAGDDEAAVAAGRAGLDGPATVAWQDADTHLTVARSLLRLGRVAEATEHAERAVALLRRWPGRRCDEATDLLSQLRVSTELTAREREVLGCVATGMSNQQVATSLGISIRTVTVHVSNLLRKTGSSSRTEAAMWAVRQGLSA